MIYEGLLTKTSCPICNRKMVQNFKEPISNCYECNDQIVRSRPKRKATDLVKAWKPNDIILINSVSGRDVSDHQEKLIEQSAA